MKITKKKLCAGLLPVLIIGLATQTRAASGNSRWTGSGELGFSSTTGNAHTQNLDAKLGLSQETAQWRNSFFLVVTRATNQEKVINPDGSTDKKYNTTANRYVLGTSEGYKLDPRSYVVSALRYAHDDFGSNRWQAVFSVGYGYTALKTQRNGLSFEVGPGFKQYKPADTKVKVDGQSVLYKQRRQAEAVIRGLLHYSHRLNANTTLENTFLTEAGSKDKYFQNDASLAVSVTRKLLLKVGYEVRHHSFVLPGAKKTDTLTTTNLAYKF